MTDQSSTETHASDDWQGFREVDRAIAENRLVSYTWKKAWADPWERRALLLFVAVAIAFLIFVMIYDGAI